MKNKNVLRSISVLAAIVCAVWSLAGCSSPSTSNVDNNPTPVVLPTLESLQLTYADGSVPAGFVFNKDTFGYLLNVPEEYAGKELTVTVQAAAGADVKITVDGTPVDAAFEVPQQGTANKTLVVAVSAGTHEAEYIVTFETAQLATMTDYSLKGIFASYTSSGTTNLASYKGGDQNGSIKVSDNTKNQAYVKATAGSGKSTIKMVYNGQEFGQSAGGGQAEGTITLPNRDTTASLDITVYSGDGKNSKTYGITVLGYVSQQVTWHGTAVYEGSDYEVSSVTARSGESVYTALLDQPVAGGWKWHFNASEFFKPTSFTMGLRKESGVDGETGQPVYTYKQSKSFTLGDLGRTGVTAAATESNPIAITVKGEQTGILIENANDLYKYLSSTDTTATYALGSNIDLSEYKENGNSVPWTGPTGFRGQFYGNGYTIKNLVLSKDGDTGLFSTLGGSAILENFTLEVSVKDGLLVTTQSVHFGGVVGMLDGNSTLATDHLYLKNITVKGDLYLRATSGYIMGGGFVGELLNSPQLTIENCVSEVNFTMEGKGSQFALGGFVGRMFAKPGVTIAIKNSYASGKVIFTSTATGNYSAISTVGGLIGDISDYGGGNSANPSNIIIENCYASGKVAYSSPKGNSGNEGTGGFIGLIHFNSKGTTNVTIRNCAALGEEALFKPETYSSTSGLQSNGRLAGYILYQNNTLVLAGNVTRLGMLTGSGDPNNEKGTADDEAALQITSGNAPLNGLGLSESVLKSESTWTSTLGWSKDLWDFSGLAAGIWPTLKPVGASN